MKLKMCKESKLKDFKIHKKGEYNYFITRQVYCWYTQESRNSRIRQNYFILLLLRLILCYQIDEIVSIKLFVWLNKSTKLVIQLVLTSLFSQSAIENCIKSYALWSAALFACITALSIESSFTQLNNQRW